jgi:hypothetical protein
VLFLKTVISKRDGTDRKEMTGTGFVVSPAGYAITVAHLVPKGTVDELAVYQVSPESRTKPPVEVQVVKRDDELDLALLRLPTGPWRPLHFGNSMYTPQDARLYTLGFPRQSDLSGSEGLLSSYYGPEGRWQTTLPLDYGNSGSPVFDIGGEVVAIAVGGLDNAKAITYVVPENYARGLRGLVASVESLSSSGNWTITGFAADPGQNEMVKLRSTATGAAGYASPFSFTVAHEEKKPVSQQFCTPGGAPIVSWDYSIGSKAGIDTQVLSVGKVPFRPDCLELKALVAGNGVDKVGGIVVKHHGPGWLSGEINAVVQAQ